MPSGDKAPAPRPFSVQPSGSFDGDDGRWSTFNVGVGTPEQTFRILPSTTGAETWIPITLGCGGALSSVADCGTLRGANNFNGIASRGFDTEASSTWSLIGTYDLATEQNLWAGTDNQGYYGLDTVTIDSGGPASDAKLSHQTVAGVATEEVWVGSLGLGTSPAHFQIKNGNIPSLLTTMKNQNLIPSLSYGYTAGASYENIPGSLILGGFDQARFKPSKLNLPIGGFKDQNLPISVESVVAQNTLAGIVSMHPNGKAIDTIIDSTVAEMWLPQSVCDLFANAFGLEYDSGTGLYLVNNTIHDQLKQLNPSVTFTIGGQGSSSPNTNIVLPYAAFDLQATLPLFNSSTNYFPLKVAANESQQVLGRAFLQEAYVFVDWERQNFTIGQAILQNKNEDIVTVLSPSFDSSGSALSIGVIVGIVAGACALLGLCVGLTTFSILRRRRSRRAQEDMPVELPVRVSQMHEIADGDPKHELVCTQISELQAEPVESELEDHGYRRSRMSRLKEKWDVYELP